MIIDRNTYWTTFDGRRVKVKDLTDAHLANVIHNLKMNIKAQAGFKFRLHNELYGCLIKEAKHRGLRLSYLKQAPIPWQDKDGEWKTLGPTGYETQL